MPGISLHSACTDAIAAPVVTKCGTPWKREHWLTMLLLGAHRALKELHAVCTYVVSRSVSQVSHGQLDRDLESNVASRMTCLVDVLWDEENERCACN
jgi:hypothetical protein